MLSRSDIRIKQERKKERPKKAKARINNDVILRERSSSLFTQANVQCKLSNSRWTFVSSKKAKKVRASLDYSSNFSLFPGKEINLTIDKGRENCTVLRWPSRD
jgi:hypothetical protein